MLIKYFLITILLIGMFYDIKWRRIPNYLTFGGMLCALELNFYFYGMAGVTQTGYGLGLAFVLLFIPFALGGLGAGDVKLLMVVGAFTGPVFTTSAFINMALIGGIYSLALMAKQETLKPLLKKIYYSVFFFTTSAARYRSLELFSKKEQPLAIPYAVAITTGTLISFWVRWV